jgi:aldehyde dehydrogenase family 7 protein A1
MEDQPLTYGDFPFLKELGIGEDNVGVYNGKWAAHGPIAYSVNPSTGKPIARVHMGNKDDYESCLKAMEAAKHAWTGMPAPKRGDIIHQIGVALQQKKYQLGSLISLEMGKILAEGLGEVQEFIDVTEYATGLSRSMSGLVIPSERPKHTILENWHPLGAIGVVTAFNFPLAVLGWNFAISGVCGNVQIWKGASTTSLVTIAVTKLIAEVLERNKIPAGVFTMISGSGATVGEFIIQDPRLSLISFTGSTEIGRRISSVVHGRFGRTILELGGNNAVIVMDDANLEMVTRAVLFAAVGTAGQRCTTCRRLIVHEKVYDDVVARLQSAYKQVRIGDPLHAETLCGPLHTPAAVKEYLDGLETIKKQGGKVLTGGKRVEGPGNYVEPTIVAIDHAAPIVKTELFVPILYVIKCSSLDEAIQINNEVPQGLSSSLFTQNHNSVFQWIGPHGSDCGIANVNIPTSGAEIGGAFGGEKETGGGRESGSDSWKQYMRRVTCTINYGNALPLAQGINFGTSSDKK